MQLFAEQRVFTLVGNQRAIEGNFVLDSGMDNRSIGFNWHCIPVPNRTVIRLVASCRTCQTCSIAPVPWWRSSGMPGLPLKATVHQNVATAEEDIGLGPHLATSQSLRAIDADIKNSDDIGMI